MIAYEAISLSPVFEPIGPLTKPKIMAKKENEDDT